MLHFLKKTANKAYTENGAVTPRTTGSDCLDLFATIGALRTRSDAEIRRRFLRAFAENPDLAMKILFYARDVRGGLGERAVFRVLLKWLAENEKSSLVRNLPYVAEYGRWDDLFVLLDTPARGETEALLRGQFEADMAALQLQDGTQLSLLGKWLPSVNASSPETVRMAKQLAKAFGLRDAEYRRALSALRAQISILENNLRTRDYSFSYAKQPSKAMFKYRAAFLRNDGARYRDYMTRVKTGAATLHTGTLMPYEIVTAAWRTSGKDRAALDVTWNALEDFTNNENALVVADGSDSMYWGGEPKPAAVAQSLAIYFAERNRGAFRSHFITFSMTPRLVEVKGADIVEKVRYCRTFNECANTDLKAVFELILQTAVDNRLPQKDLPSTLYIVSDMEFDSCTYGASMSNFEYAKKRYMAHGYKLPRVVFWNVQSRNEQQPVKMNEQGVALVSGCTARIFSQVMSGEMDPYANMMQVVGAKRYDVIRAG
ncbi:MAG: DUF2828 family protein [Eubacteriales bacterium]|nr:DUF2828 family protein [Eubacteriales bacterium]